MPLSYSERAHYIEGPAACPYCGGYHIAPVGPLEGDEKALVAKQKIGCSCGRTWNDVYKLHDIEELE